MALDSMLRGLALAALILLSSLFAAGVTPPDCVELLDYVYRVKLWDPVRPPGKGPWGFGGGFFVSAEGEFVTALHLFEDSPNATGFVVEVRNGTARIDCPIEEVTAYSRELDFVTVRVRLNHLRVDVPPVALSTKIGEIVTGFTVGTPATSGVPAGPTLCTRGVVSAVSSRQVTTKGTWFFLPGSSGSPVFNSSGSVISMAKEMVNLNPRARRAEWVYTSLPIRQALFGARLAQPMTPPEFLAMLRGSAR